MAMRQKKLPHSRTTTSLSVVCKTPNAFLMERVFLLYAPCYIFAGFNRLGDSPLGSTLPGSQAWLQQRRRLPGSVGRLALL